MHAAFYIDAFDNDEFVDAAFYIDAFEQKKKFYFTIIYKESIRKESFRKDILLII